jgi:hypothetical protein
MLGQFNSCQDFKLRMKYVPKEGDSKNVSRTQLSVSAKVSQLQLSTLAHNVVQIYLIKEITSLGHVESICILTTEGSCQLLLEYGLHTSQHFLIDIALFIIGFFITLAGKGK